MIKKFQCPFCLETFNSRQFLNHVHVPQCMKREDYFSKLLSPEEMEEIELRVNGGIVQREYIKTKTFEGKALPKEEL